MLPLITKCLAFLFILLIVLTISTYSQNQKISIEQFGIDKGMLSAGVFSCIQDRKGFLWFATQAGLDRYDGYSFTSYKYPLNSKLIGEAMPGTLAEDKQGNIWVASLNGGVEKFDPEKQIFKNFIPDTSKPPTDYANSVYEVFIDRNDMIWLGTGNGLYKFDKEKETFTIFRYDEKDPFSLGHNAVDGIYEDKSGTLWLATGGGLDRYDREENKFYHYWHYPNNPWGDPNTNMYWLHQIIEDGDSVLWIGSDCGILKFNKKSEECTLFHRDRSTAIGWNKSIIMSLLEDKSGRIWLGTPIGIDIFNKNTNTFLDLYPEGEVIKSLDQKMILSYLFDKSGLLWIVTDFDGVYKLNFPDPSFKTYVQKLGGKKEFLLDRVLNFWEETDGNIWVCTDEGYCLLDLKNNRLVRKYNFNKNLDVWKIGDGLWAFPSLKGLYKLDIKEKKWECYLDSINNKNYLYSGIGIGKDENMWLGNRRGDLFSLELKTKELKFVTNIKGTIYAIFQDSYGLVWFGGFSTSLYCYDPEKNSITEYKSDPNDSTTIIDDSFYCYYEDNNRTLWFGCLNGIVRYNRSENNFTRYYANNDFMNEIVRHILEDDNGNLWISAENGITKLNPKTGEFTYYYSSKYFPEIEFYRLVGYKASNGEMYFGGKNGFVRFHPDSIKENKFIPSIAITGFKKFDKYYSFGEEIELEYDDNFLTFEFAALSYLNSKKNQYAYMMEGVDRDWVYCGTKRFAYYPSLASGNYIFRVKGSDCNLVWNEAGTSIEITILPPWWKTWWAYLLYSLIFVSIFISSTKFYLGRQGLKQKLVLESEHAEKLEELSKMKSNFFANISHEFRTPLTLIHGPAQKIVNKESIDPVKDASIITRNSKRLLNLVNQLLDLSKLDSGKLKLEASLGNIVTFVKGAALSFESLIESKDIRIKIKSSSDLIEVYFDREKIMKILSNLLSNAFKFTPERGSVLILISELPNKTVEIKIRNTGMGIARSEIPKLFDRFYQVDSSQTKEYEGTGIGLALTKELVELHYGSITVDSEFGKWAEFKIFLPLGKEHLETDQIVASDESSSFKEEVFIDDKEYLNSKVADNVEVFKDPNSVVILVVEDNYDMREYIKESLSDSYTIEEAVNGEQGVRIAQTTIPDLIISDLMMPKMDGNELTKLLRNDERTNHIPIIILTAKSGQDNKIEGLEKGADDYLTKPFDVRELRVRVENLINIRRKLQEKFSRGEFLFKRNDRKFKSVDEKFLARILEIIELHLAEEDFSIEEFSKEIGMSRTHLHKKIKALVGKSPSQYLRTVRLHRAKQMIEEEKGNISEVAYSVGFSSLPYFSKCYRDEFGYPPRDTLN